MNTSGNALYRALIVGSTLVFLAVGSIYASCPNNLYLNGTYVLNGSYLGSYSSGSPPTITSLPAGRLTIASFDGSGGVIATEEVNTNGIITSQSSSTTYCVATDGTFTIGTTEPVNGYFSHDGNTIEVSDLTAGSHPIVETGVKYGSISNGNNASGLLALAANTTGINNTAMGYKALYASTTANYNVAIGYQALNSSRSGLGNIGVGPLAGKNIILGELNIDVGSWGTSDESNTIRIGISPYHQHTYIAGIYNTTGLSGLPVIVTSTGQLGVAPVSSERFKTGIATMGPATEKLSQLRPVTFQLKSDAQGTVHYGLIAEEVAKVYPELVIRDANGRIDGVHYDELAPMLLNEMQKQERTVAAQDAVIRELKHEVGKVRDLERELTEMHASLLEMQSKDQLFAHR
jgi:hypothetical protein